MNFSMLSFTQQAILTLAGMVMFTSFALLAQSRIVATIHIFAWQGALLSIATALIAFDTGLYHLYISALLTFAIKVIFIPWLLHRLVNQMGVQREQDLVMHTGFIQISAVALVVFCYNIALPIEQFSTSVTRPIIGISMGMIMLGMLMLITRHKAVSQVIGFMAMENGLFFAAVSATHGMPMIVELGIAFDVLVAAIIFGVFFFHIRDSFDSLDTDQLSNLSEGDE